VNFELSDEQRLLRDTVRDFARGEVAPVAEELDRTKAFPYELVKKMGDLGLMGIPFPEEYGGGGADTFSYALAVEELARIDSSVAITMAANTSLGTMPINLFGSARQKEEWMPALCSGERLAAFGLTEPDAGSDPVSMRSRARRDGTDWVLDARKMWITNGSVADVAVVWAQTDEGVRGFVVPTDVAGFSAPLIKHKMSLRASVTSELVLEGVRLPADAVLPGVVGLKGPLTCLNEARYGIVWGAVGAARSSLQCALEYAGTRVQFGRPIAGFQLTQAKIADMTLEVVKGTLLALHLGRAKDARGLLPVEVSLGKLNNVREALEVCRTARTVLGANGISLESPVIRHMVNLESVLTYEGTSEMHALSIGQAMTGESAFR
jgi:glutaryl-CoA dehydrogenase